MHGAELGACVRRKRKLLEQHVSSMVLSGTSAPVTSQLPHMLSEVGACTRRKRKLLEKQKEGKARMRRVGSVDLPQAVFYSLMRT